MRSCALIALLLVSTGCPSEAPVVPTAEGTASAAAPSAQPPVASAEPIASAVPEPAAPSGPDPTIGGRLFDKFDAERSVKSGFKPDDAKTRGKPDGTGGPSGNGTLMFAAGKPMLNDAGHDYRLKNLFGWDLKGREGISAFVNKTHAVNKNLLTMKGSAPEIIALLKQGEGAIPAYGSVLGDAELAAIAELVVSTRERKLPHPDDIFETKPFSAGNYVLKPGGNAVRGKEIYAVRCSACHGPDGTRELFDNGELSLGAHARQKAYEDWFKIANGQPGTAMESQVSGSGKERTQQILDLLAALCDRTAFPLGKAKGKDVPNGDPRCGAYLK
ncbi:MAG: hypothetical protein JNK04_00855 [Myxococcales bacterium]|nr:hypothetical protein [Myxococcales bacterium]